jgi:murein DD-endopeptidase MepM/ murein hydrolase activator NlpD
VTFAGDKGPNGRVVELDLGDGVTMKFAHLDDISVAVGAAVKTGGTIGTVGNTGRSTGSHVHVEVYRNGKAYDPESVENLTLSTR